MQIQSLDHLVLTVTDMEATLAFYRDILGMEVREFDQGRTALCFGTQKINLHPRGAEITPHAAHPTPGSADICLLTTDSMAAIMAHLQKNHIDILTGPVWRTGACSPILSVYLRDPDGNLVEIATQPSSTQDNHAA